jgi:hypothetical protein
MPKVMEGSPRTYFDIFFYSLVQEEIALVFGF